MTRTLGQPRSSTGSIHLQTSWSQCAEQEEATLSKESDARPDTAEGLRHHICEVRGMTLLFYSPAIVPTTIIEMSSIPPP